MTQLVSPILPYSGTPHNHWVGLRFTWWKPRNFNPNFSSSRSGGALNRSLKHVAPRLFVRRPSPALPKMGTADETFTFAAGARAQSKRQGCGKGADSLPTVLAQIPRSGHCILCSLDHMPKPSKSTYHVATNHMSRTAKRRPKAMPCFASL